ncbi:MAG: type I CRISPR-associated protein Cas7, partial [Candidatus Cloacimonetes bacterium]|nr:type I CRISPR-associated protein Cas7 [Candidatus Cloacimonadota bacterium]
MKNRVYGVLGIGSYMANWNADFTNYPKTIGDGSVYGSDKALKYSIRNYMNEVGKPVLIFKSFIEGKDQNLQPRTLD